MKVNYFPKIAPQEFMLRLKTRKHENLDVIGQTESFFRKNRKFVFRMPKPDTPIILLVSGGLDSTIAWCMLLELYKLKVYPLFLHGGTKRSDKEEKAISYYSHLYKKRYPDLFVEPMRFSLLSPPPEIAQSGEQMLKQFDPQLILNKLNTTTHSVQFHSHGTLPFTYPLYALAYALHVYDQRRLRIHTIFNAVVPTDGLGLPSQSFTALRTNLLCFYVITGSMNWQFSSIFLEKELGLWVEKNISIQLAKKLNIPLEHTWSCYRAGTYQCGDRCPACNTRKKAFQKAGIVDRTKYANNSGVKRFIQKMGALLDRS